jgi:hypothetical protein
MNYFETASDINRASSAYEYCIPWSKYCVRENLERIGVNKIIIAWLLAALFAPVQLLACDRDSDCGAGGTCIKREKRGRGVCYGGDYSRSDKPDARALGRDDTSRFDNTDTQASGNGDMPHYDHPDGIVPQHGMFNSLINPGERPEGTCIVSQECPAGMECVIAGPRGGRCMAL